MAKTLSEGKIWMNYLEIYPNNVTNFPQLARNSRTRHLTHIFFFFMRDVMHTGIQR